MVGGQQSTRSLPHLAELFRLADAAGLLEQPDLAVRAHEARCWRCTGFDRMRDFAPTTAGCRSTPPPCAASAARTGRCCRSSTPAPRAASAPSSPWRDQVAAAGLANTARAHAQTHGIELSGYCRGGMFTGSRRRRPPGRARRQPARARRSLHAAAHPAWCWWSAACPARWAARRRTRTSPARARRSPTASRRLLDDARERGMPLAIEPLHPMYAADRACVNTLEQALDLCDALDPQRSGALGVARRRLPRLVGPEAAGADRARRHASACSPSTSATG